MINKASTNPKQYQSYPELLFFWGFLLVRIRHGPYDMKITGMRLNGLNIVESFSWWELHNRSCLSTISLIQPFEPLAEKVDEIPGGLNQAVLTSTIRLSPSKLVAKQMLSQQGRCQSTHLERPGDPVAGHEIGVCFLDSLRDQNHQTINNTEMYVETFFKAVANSLHVKHKRYQSEVKSKDHEHPRRTYWC